MNIEKALKDAGIFGLPFSWGTDGKLEFDDAITPAQKTKILKTFAALDLEAANAWAGYQSEARKLLDATDLTALRCWKAGVPFPKEWQSYTAALRAIVGASSGDPSLPFPPCPDYPKNT